MKHKAMGEALVWPGRRSDEVVTMYELVSYLAEHFRGIRPEARGSGGGGSG